MKAKPIVSAIVKAIAHKDAEVKATRTRNIMLETMDHAAKRGQDAPAHYIAEHLLALTEAANADAAFRKLPPAMREQASRSITIATALARSIAERCGGRYSGQTSDVAEWGTIATAHTSTSRGDRYSGKCTYSKTDATHIVTLDPAGVPLLIESEALRHASARDGLHLIALYPDGSAVWVKTRGKAIVSERGWVAGNGACCYHSTKSLEHAQKGFERKHATVVAELRQRRLTNKQARRVRLIARLCGHVEATMDDAHALGYCDPGIRAFQAKHGLGDTASLPELVRTGDANAVRLALSIARKVQAQDHATA